MVGPGGPSRAHAVPAFSHDAISMTIDLLDHALQLRMFATAAIVIAVSWSVGAFGPWIGGALAGLPMVLGPAFFFLIQQASASFVATSASYTLHTLSATQFFLLAYIFAARRLRPLLALCCAFLAWVGIALLCRQLPPWPLLGASLFVLVTWGAVRLSKPLVAERASSAGKASWPILFFRGALAGILVAVVTTSASWLGAASAGILLAYPIAYTVIATTVHERFGVSSVIATLHSGLTGCGSLAVFCFLLAVLPGYIGSWPALGIATAGSVCVTLALVNRSRFRRLQK